MPVIQLGSITAGTFHRFLLSQVSRNKNKLGYLLSCTVTFQILRKVEKKVPVIDNQFHRLIFVPPGFSLMIQLYVIAEFVFL